MHDLRDLKFTLEVAMFEFQIRAIVQVTLCAAVKVVRGALRYYDGQRCIAHPYTIRLVKYMPVGKTGKETGNENRK
jgi:hypothetical protein